MEREGQENQNTLAVFDLESVTVTCEESLSKAVKAKLRMWGEAKKGYSQLQSSRQSVK